MTTLNFPDTPAVGELFGSLGTLWRWDGARWASTAGVSGGRGIVAKGSILSGITLTSGSYVTTTNPLTFSSVAGRTYRVRYNVRAIGEGSAANTYVHTNLTINGVNASGSQPLLFSPVSAYTWASYEWLIQGDGTAKTLLVAMLAALDVRKLYAEPEISGFYVEDITYEAGSGGPSTTPSAWTPLTLQNGWVNFGEAGVAVPSYRVNGWRVETRGNIKNGTLGAVAFTYPVGARPLSNTVLPTLAATAGSYAVVAQDGTVQLAISNNYHYLDAITFPLG